MAATQTIDEAAVDAFVGRALGDLGGAMTTLFCALGDRLGLLKALDADGPVSSEDRRRGSASTSGTYVSGCAG